MRVIFTIFICLFAFSSMASAKGGLKGVSINGALFISHFGYDEKLDEADDTVNYTNQAYDLQFGGGYIFDMGLYLGLKALYSSSATKGTFEITSGTTVIEAESEINSTELGYGVSLGYFADRGFNFMVSYLPVWGYEEVTTSSYTSGTENETTVDHDGGTGLLVEIGYAFMVSKSFGFGPNLMYKSTTHTKKTTTVVDDGTTVSETEVKGTYVNSAFYPYVGFWTAF